MPYRANAAATAAKGVGNSSTNSAKLTNGSMNEEVDSGDKANSKKSSSATTPSTKRSNTVSAGDALQNGIPKPNFTSRRRQSSIPKLPMGPRPLDHTGSKRSVSNTIVQSFNNIRGASAVASQDPHTKQLSINDVSRFSFASIPASNTPQHDLPDEQLDFGNFLEPTFNFDAFHDNITVTEPSLNNFPFPNGPGPAQPNDEQELSIKQQKRISTQPAIPIPTRKASVGVPLGPPLSRNESDASSNDSKPLAQFESMSNSNSSTTSLRARRQSGLPPNAFNNNASNAPRKSIGPGTYVVDIPDKTENVKRTPSDSALKPDTESSKAALSARTLNKKGEISNETTKSSRAAKTKSFLGSKRSDPSETTTPSKTPDPTGLSGVPAQQSQLGAQTPSRPPGTPGRTTTPGATASTNRRMSIYATGLGARTVSPTDARRLKRMSMLPPAPPIPNSRISQAPPTPQPDPPSLRSRSTAQSPAGQGRKSQTPSSSRTTPDPNRKSYSSGQSLSSSTSYNSKRNSASLHHRLSQNLNGSRLPTPKPRLEINSSGDFGAIVPPVPAIPKAYESPCSDMEQPFFSARSSSLPPIDTPISASPVVTTFAEAMKTLETPRAPSSSSRPVIPAFAESMKALETPRAPSSSSRLSVVLQSILPESKHKPLPQPTPSQLPTQVATPLPPLQIPPSQPPPPPPPQAQPNKRHTLSLRLPPLNLLPLSTPTAAKINSLKEPKIPPTEPPGTPTAVRNNMTPSTPMTASKASFFSRAPKAIEDSNFIRSSTSHHGARPNSMRPTSGGSPILPIFSFENDTQSDRNISPFISSSVPKSSGEFTNFMRSNFMTESHRTSVHGRPNGPRAPSFSINTPKPLVEPSPVEKPAESESVFSASAIRRKLSRKLSGTKFNESMQLTDDLSKYDNMPPPKLPASATWTNQQNPSGSPTQRNSFIKSRRQPSSSSISLGPKRQDSFDSAMTHLSAARPSIESTRSALVHPERSGSLSAPSSQSKHAQPISEENVLDRDDLVAEEEMKKLASKRKDFESAAQELDALRARARPAQRMSANTAMQLHNLNIYERGEIVDYPDVYFTGTKHARKVIGDMSSSATNFGYDDDRGDYNIVEGDHLAYRYEVVDLLGKGSFGQVVRCVDHKTGILVAVKIIRNKKRFHQQALVEVNILQRLKEWDPHKKHSVVNFDQSFYFRNHLCISTDLLGMNLYEFIKAHDFRGFSIKLIRRFTKQLLNSLVLLHKHKVIHCDLKPENILLAHPVHSEIKVIDFGSSCFENEKVYTYIQSRFYRSPEVILGMSYGMPIDMWSVGCILAELYTGYPIFPGENEQEQLACIMEVFGPPEKHLIEKSSRKKLFFDSMGKPRLTVSSKGRRRRPSSKDLRQVLKCDDEAFLDFIARCLRWDPVRRLNPHDAIKHEFITGVKMIPNNSRRAFVNPIQTPIKRVNSITSGSGTRPLPQPPSSTLKVNAARQDSLGLSPIKGTSRRQSTFGGFQAAAASAKRASHVAISSSTSNPNLMRVGMGQRSMSTRSDLAAAAAAASMVK